MDARYPQAHPYLSNPTETIVFDVLKISILQNIIISKEIYFHKAA